jgi:cell division protein FtsL
MKKQKKSAPREKNTGKFVSSEDSKLSKVEKKDYTFIIIFFISVIFFLFLILNNTRILNSITTLNFEKINNSIRETIPSSVNENLKEETILVDGNKVEVAIDSSKILFTEDKLKKKLLNPDQVARILVQYGNVSILSKGDLKSNENLYPGKIIKNGDQITVGKYPSYISFIINNENSVIVMYNNTNAQIVFNESTNLYKIKEGKIHANIMSSIKPTVFVSQNSKVTIDDQDVTLMNLLFNKGQDQFVTIEGKAKVKNELSGLSLRMIKQQKLFSTNIGQLIWSLANELDFNIGPNKKLVILPIEDAPVKKIKPIKIVQKKFKITPKLKPKIIIKAIKPAPPKPVENYDKTREYDFNIAPDIIKQESIVTYLETPLMGDIPVYYFPNINSELVSSISDQEKFIVYPIYRSGFVVIGRLGTGPLGYADADLINFSSEDRLGKIIDLSKSRFIIDN